MRDLTRVIKKTTLAFFDASATTKRTTLALAIAFAVLVGSGLGVLSNNTSSNNASHNTNISPGAPVASAQSRLAQRTPREEQWSNQRNNSGANVTLRVLIVYTPDALALVPRGDINAQTNDIVRSQNRVFANSGVKLRVTSAGSIAERPTTPIDPSDARHGNWLFDHLGDDRVFPRMHEARRATNADITMIMAGRLTDVAGLATENTGQHAKDAIGIVDLSSIIENNIGTFAHEFGHTLGLRHDPAQLARSKQKSSPDANVGYVDPKSRVRDLMSYDSACDKRAVCMQMLTYSMQSNVEVYDLTHHKMMSIPLGDAHHDASGYINARLDRYAAMNYNAGN